jgi:multiple sugar transport system substrate-binding protein
MLDYARRLTVRERGGAIRTLGLRPPDLIYIIGAFGGQFVDPHTGAPTADHPVNLHAARYYRALIEAMGDGKAVQAFTMSFGNEQGTNNPFFLGKIAMMINGQWNTYWFQKYAPHVPYAIAPIPYPAGKPHLRRPTWIGQNMFCIPRESRHPREAWDFFMWMQREEAQLLFAETMHGLPNIRRMLEAPPPAHGAPPRRGVETRLREVPGSAGQPQRAVLSHHADCRAVPARTQHRAGLPD